MADHQRGQNLRKAGLAEQFHPPRTGTSLLEAHTHRERGGGGVGPAKFGAVKMWHQLSSTIWEWSEKFLKGGTTSLDPEWLPLLPEGFLWMPAIISRHGAIDLVSSEGNHMSRKLPTVWSLT